MSSLKHLEDSIFELELPGVQNTASAGSFLYNLNKGSKKARTALKKSIEEAELSTKQVEALLATYIAFGDYAEEAQSLLATSEDEDDGFDF